MNSPPRVLAHQLRLGQRSKSQGHKVQRDDRVAGESYALYRVPNLQLCIVIQSIFASNTRCISRIKLHRCA